MRKQIENNFKYHSPSGDQPQKYEQIRSEAKKFALLINDLCPGSREKSLAMTKLEESVMWANASIARNLHQTDIRPDDRTFVYTPGSE